MIHRWLTTGVLITSCGIANAGECVILLHGMARTSGSMSRMKSELVDAGFQVINVSYPSRKYTIEVLAPMAIDKGLRECRVNKNVTTIHFVTHSLGGILLRQYLANTDIPELGRVVMMAPPNQGSAAADKMRRVPGYDWVNGPPGRQLGKGEDSLPLKLGPADYELGIIAGRRTFDPITSLVLDNPDDGRVSVEDTKLDGMKDFVVVSHSHTFMMRMRKTIDLTIRFLKTGSFGDA